MVPVLELRDLRRGEVGYELAARMAEGAFPQRIPGLERGRVDFVPPSTGYAVLTYRQGDRLVQVRNFLETDERPSSASVALLRAIVLRRRGGGSGATNVLEPATAQTDDDKSMYM
jgi:hypothetical protein